VGSSRPATPGGEPGPCPGRTITAGRGRDDARTGGPAALAYFALPAVDAAEKDAMRALAMRGGPYTPDEQAALLAYCQTDVDALVRLDADWDRVKARLTADVNARYGVYEPADPRPVRGGVPQDPVPVAAGPGRGRAGPHRAAARPALPGHHPTGRPGSPDTGG
jgi:hypothetical protein